MMVGDKRVTMLGSRVGVLVLTTWLVIAVGFGGGEAAASGRAGGHVIASPAASLTGPITTGHIVEPLSALPTNLARYGYVEREYFASGTASAFAADSPSGTGRWMVTPTTSATYRTRILVRRPANPARFNGTVIVEWMNVSGGESAPDWDYLNPMLMRDGFAYVAVSAQSLGVDGGTAILGQVKGNTGGLVAAEPDRYGSLHHPGDQYAMDIFAQVAAALRGPKNLALAGLRPRHLVATGESQSAFYLTTFADAIQPRTNAFDGIFIHSRGGAGAALDGAAITSSKGPTNLRIRTDLRVPVFMFETQTDLIELGYAAAQQPNTAKIRTWEVAGTSHADAFLVGKALGVLGCAPTVNDGPQHEVVQAAFAAFNRWVSGGRPPPGAAPFQFKTNDPPTLALDRHGNVIGGVRTPAVDVPISTLSGSTPPGTSEICSLFGSSMPFNSQMLHELYRTKENYLRRFQTSLDRAIHAGFILGADRSSLEVQAHAVALPATG